MPDKNNLIKALLVLALAGGAIWGWKTFHASDSQSGQVTPDGKEGSDEQQAPDRNQGKRKHGKGGGFHGQGDRPTPVLAATVTKADIPVVLTALGTATPSAVVTVTSRVDGQLIQVQFQEGQLVKQGQLLARIDPRPFETALGQIQGQAARNQALLKNSQIDLERFKTLQSQDSIASQQVDSQASLVQQYQGTVQADRALVESAKLQLAFTNITAPISGRIGLRQVDSGNNITAANPIAVINAVHPIHVVFTLPEDKITRLVKQTQSQSGSHAPVVEAWDKSNTQLLAKGVLKSIDNQIDTTSGTIKLKAEFTNLDNNLFPNQFVNIRLHSETLRNASVVPVNAVQHNNQGAFVYLIKSAEKGEIVSLHPVTVGYNDGERAAITSGLQAGDRVVSSGVDKLKDQAQVMVKDPRRGAATDAPQTQPDQQRRKHRQASGGA